MYPELAVSTAWADARLVRDDTEGTDPVVIVQFAANGTGEARAAVAARPGQARPYALRGTERHDRGRGLSCCGLYR